MDEQVGPTPQLTVNVKGQKSHVWGGKPVAALRLHVYVSQRCHLIIMSSLDNIRYKRCLNPSGSCLRRNVGLDKLLPLIDDGKKVGGTQRFTVVDGS